jgi:hypothetical protein
MKSEFQKSTKIEIHFLLREEESTNCVFLGIQAYFLSIYPKFIVCSIHFFCYSQH